MPPVIDDRDRREQELTAALALALRSLGSSFDAGSIDYRTFIGDAQRAFAATLTGVYVDSANILGAEHGVDLEADAKAAADAYVAAGSMTLARSMAINTAKALSKSPLQPGAGATSFLFSPSRAEGAAISEITRTATRSQRTASGLIAARLAGTMQAFCKTAEDDDVCPICAPLNNKPEFGPGGWSSVNPEGSPFHNRCRCEIVYRFVPLVPGGRQYADAI